MKKNHKSKSVFALKICLIICMILSVFVGGYFFLDKLIVPKYFGNYGIYSIGDLVGVISSLYSTPKESELVTNGYTQDDLSNAIVELRKANYKIQDDGTILEKDIENFKGDGQVTLTDREFAAVCEKLIQNGMLQNSLPDLNYLNIINLSVLELKISPDKTTLNKENNTYTKANIKFIAKIGTKDIREQISLQMNTPMYLLKIIIPDTLYFTVDYNIDLLAEKESRTAGTIAINGKNEKQSETLINLLIEFIFPEEDKMDKDKFTRAIGDVVLRGIDALGDFKFVSNLKNKTSNGIVIN